MKCPMEHKVRPELPPLTQRIAALPVDERGYPVPFFVQWLDAENNAAEDNAPGARPEFRMMNGQKFVLCYRRKLCWVCGQPRGEKATFVIGAMCAINRTSSEMPCHYECAEWSVKGCPFLSRPNMVRREDDLIRSNKENTAGIAIERNPGVSLLWTSRNFRPFKAHNNGGYLMNVGHPINVSWWREGRAATREEIMESIDSGIPQLRELCVTASDHADLIKRYQWLINNLLP